MKIAVGSANPVKIGAVRDAVRRYPVLTGAIVTSVDVKSGVSEQPKSLEETVQGAKNRALSAFTDAHLERPDLGFGLEGGLVVVPGTRTGVMNCCVCAIYDGRDYSIGTSSLFECPQKVIVLIFNKGLDLNTAFLEAKITKNEDLGSHEGAVGLLTKGRITRREYAKQSIFMALIQLENEEFYKH